jgi:hypothetical protein
VSAMSPQKTTFAMAGFEPRTFWSRETDVPTQALCSHNLRLTISTVFQ